MKGNKNRIISGRGKKGEKRAGRSERVNRPPTVTIDAIDDVGGRMEGSRGLMTIEIHNEARRNVNENRIYCEGDSVAGEMSVSTELNPSIHLN